MFRRIAKGRSWISVVIVACLVGLGAGNGEAAETLSLRVTLYPGSLISFPAYVAQHAGFFERNNLNVQLIDVKGGPDATAAVVSGSADIMLNATDLNMLSRQRGQDIVAVAGDTSRMIFSLIVRNEIPTPNLSKGYPDVMKDLKGLKIGVTQRGASVELFTRALLKDAKLDPDKDAIFVGVGLPPTALPALEQRQIEAYMAFEPMQTLAVDVRKIAKIVVDLRKGEGSKLFKEWNYNSWAAKRSNVQAKAEAFARFQKAMRETHEWMQNPVNFEALVDIAAKAMKQDKDVLRIMLRNNLDTFGYKITRQAIENASTFLLETGQLKKPVTYEEYVYAGT